MLNDMTPSIQGKYICIYIYTHNIYPHNGLEFYMGEYTPHNGTGAIKGTYLILVPLCTGTGLGGVSI